MTTEPAEPTRTTGMGSILKESTYYLIGSLASRAIGFLFIPFYAHHLSPAQYGLVELVELSTQTIAIALGLQAIGLVLTRIFYEQPTDETRKAVVSTAVIATFILSTAVALLAIAAAEPLSELVFHTPEWASLLRAAFVAMLFSNMMEVVLVYERIQNRARFFLIYTTVLLVVSVGLNVLFIGVLETGVWGFVATKLIVSILGTVYLLVRTRRDVGWRWRPTYLPEFTRLGVPLVISALAFFIFHFSDRFFLTGWVSLADLGRYSLAYKMAMLVSVLTGDAFSKSWEATLFRYTDQAGWQIQFAKVADYLTVALFATGLGVALFSPSLMQAMVPADYLPPPMVIPVIVLSYVAREIGDFFRNLLLINKRAGMVSRISVGGAVVNLATNAMFIPVFGVMGAAYATLATWVAYMVACWVVANAEHRLPMRLGAYVWILLLSAALYAGGIELNQVGLVRDALLDGFLVAGFMVLGALTFLTRAERQQAWVLAGPAWLWLQARLGRRAGHS